MPGEAGPEPTTAIGLRLDLMYSIYNLCSFQMGHWHNRDAPESRLRPALRERMALCLKEMLESTFGGHLTSKSMLAWSSATCL